MVAWLRSLSGEKYNEFIETAEKVKAKNLLKGGGQRKRKSLRKRSLRRKRKSLKRKRRSLRRKRRYSKKKETRRRNTRRRTRRK
jgi:hypothetical protein